MQPIGKTHFLYFMPLRNPRIDCLVSRMLRAKNFLERFSDEAKDISKGRAGDIPTVIKLVFRTYHQYQQDEWASKCLDLIDRTCLEGIDEIRGNLDEYER